VPRIDPTIALAVLRIATGLLAFPHGLRKLINGPVASIGEYIAAQGLPPSFAYVITLGELAGLLMMVGLFTRFASAVVALTMASIAFGGSLSEAVMLGTGESLGFELSLMLAVSATLCVLAPATRISLDALRRR
jgi:putative oxidoreductase